METQEPAKSFLYDILLPKLELIYVLISAAGLVLFWNSVKGGSALCIVGLGGLATVSFLNAFSPYNSINTDEPYFEPVAIQTLDGNESSFFLDILAPKIAGIAGAVVLAGTLFKLMFWTGYSTMLLVGTALLLTIVVVMAFNQRMNLRAFILAALGSLMLYIPTETLMRQIHSDDPKRVTLMVYQIQHPHDRAAADAVHIHVNQKRIQR
jgi:hypothetical protein